MPKPKTSEAASIINAFYRIERTVMSKFKTITKTHVNAALTQYLRTLSVIGPDEEVTNFNKAPDALDVKIEKVNEDA